MADPVMKEVIDGSGMKSTMNPILVRPINVTMPPQMTVVDRAICGPGMSGYISCTSVTTVPITVDMTATGWRACQCMIGNNRCETYPEGDVFGCCKQPVYHSPHERGVKSILDGQSSQFRVAEALRDHDGANSSPCLISEMEVVWGHSGCIPAMRSPTSH